MTLTDLYWAVWGISDTFNNWGYYLLWWKTWLETSFWPITYLAPIAGEVASWCFWAKAKVWLFYDWIKWVRDSIPASIDLGAIQNWVVAKLNELSASLSTWIQATSDALAARIQSTSDWLVEKLNTTATAISARITAVEAWIVAKLNETSAWLVAQLNSTATAIYAWIQAVYNSLLVWIEKVRVGLFTWIQTVYSSLAAWIQRLSDSYNPLQLAALWALYAALADIVSSLYAALKLFVNRDYPIVNSFLNNPALFVWAEVKRRIEDATWRQFSRWIFPLVPLPPGLPEPRAWLAMKVDNFFKQRENWPTALGAIETRWREIK